MGGKDLEDDPLERLVCECLERIEQRGAPALEEVCREHPEHADALRAEIGKLARMGMLESTPGAPPEAFPDRLGDFRLLERLGGGGMGVVYAAEQVSLGRRVALKLIRPENLFFPGSRERFRREVEAVARLAHPGIVPVYVVGEEDGVPYYAMELVPGCTLADVLREMQGTPVERLSGRDLAQAIERCAARRADRQEEGGQEAGRQEDGRREERARAASGGIFEGSWTDACFRLARQVADALEHAHGRGVLHRDVKPSNVAITRAGRAMLLDFGLAATAGSASRLTRSGSQPGSLPYMSPEQVRGEKDVDQRTGVYSLGVTLYELLTLRPAFGTTSGEETRRRIAAGEVRRAREVNRALPRDAETVCLTAMERERSRRYATAADFARDLGNVLARRPIEAQRPGTWLLIVRFAQRHPTPSAAAAAALVLALSGAVIFGWQQRQHGHELRAERDVARQRAEELRALATSFIFEFDAKIRDLAGSTPARELVVEKARELLEKLSVAAREDLALQGDLATAYLAFGDVLQTGRDTEARQSFEKARALYEELQEREPADARWKGGLSDALFRIGNLERLNGNLDVSLDLLGRALSAAEPLLSENPTNHALRQYVARVLLCLARVRCARGELDAGLESQLRAIDLYRLVVEADPSRPDLHDDLASAWDSLADINEAMGRGDVLACRATAVEESERAVKEEPTNARYRNKLSGMLCGLAIRTDDAVLAEKAVRRALEIAEWNVAAEPANPDSTEALVQAYFCTGNVHYASGRRDAALEAYSRVVRLAETSRGIETGTRLRSDAAWALVNTATAQLALQRHDEARQSCLRAAEAFEQIVSEEPGNRRLVLGLLIARDQLVVATTATGDAVEAVRLSEQVLNEAEALGLPSDASADGREVFGQVHCHSAWALQAAGRIEEALERYRIGTGILAELLRADPMRGGVAKGQLEFGLDAWRGLARALGRQEEEYACQVVRLSFLEARASHVRASSADLERYARELLTCSPADLRDPVLALEHAGRAVERSATPDAQVLGTLALACFETGDAQAAVEMVERALLQLDSAPAEARGANVRADLEARRAQFRAALED